MKYTKGKLYGTIVDKDLFTGPVGFVTVQNIRFDGLLQARTPFVLLDYFKVVETFYRFKALTAEGKISWFLCHENQVLPIEELI